MIIHDDCTQNLKISLQTFMNKIIVVLYISYIAMCLQRSLYLCFVVAQDLSYRTLY